LNGEEKGNTPLVTALLVGNYDLKLSFDGYLDSNEKFSLTDGENKTLKINMLTYAGSIKQKKDFWKKQKWIALGAFTASAAAGGYFQYSGDNYYDEYLEQKSTSDAESTYDKVLSADRNRNISFSVSLAPLGYFFYSWYKESSYK
jgi:hypothetical protein